MRRVDPPPLMPLALRVLEEEVTRAEVDGRRTWAARFALAYLGSQLRLFLTADFGKPLTRNE